MIRKAAFGLAATLLLTHPLLAQSASEIGRAEAAQRKSVLVTAHINASPVPKDLKDYFTGRVVKAMAKDFPESVRGQELERVDDLLTANEREFARWEELQKHISGFTGYPATLRDYYLGLAKDLRKQFPDHVASLFPHLQRVRDGMDQYVKLIDRYRALIKSVQDDPKTSAAFRLDFARRLNEEINMMGPSNITGFFQAYETHTTEIVNHLSAVGRFDAMAARVPGEIPAGYDAFRQSTLAQIVRDRAQVVGGSNGRIALDALEGKYKHRLGYIKELAAIRDKIAKMPAAKAKPFQERHDKLLLTTLDYSGLVDQIGIRNLATDVNKG